MKINRKPNFHLRCECYPRTARELYLKGYVLEGLTYFSDNEGSRGIGCIFRSYRGIIKGKGSGGIIHFSYCPFCGKRIERRGSSADRIEEE